MSSIDALGAALQTFRDYHRKSSVNRYWEEIGYRKWDYFNAYKNVCKHLGFVTNGVFRSYMIDEKTGEEKNVFLYSSNQFVVSFKSFIN